jgi:lysozyme family protein
MRLLTVDKAREIAKTQYWDIMKLDSIAELSPPIAAELFDTGFLCGVGNAGRFLQESLNMFNRSNREPPDYPDVKDDGLIGPMTVWCLRCFLEFRHEAGERTMLKALNAAQGQYLKLLVRSRKKDEEFAFGWFLNRVEILGG